MPRRTPLFQQLPWTGGLNTAVDPGVIPPNDLVQADNMVFTTAGIRRKREGFSYFDSNSDIPASVSRSSSGTTRKITFGAAITNATVDQLAVGEMIVITTSAAGNNEATYFVTTGALITAISTTNVTDDTIEYTGVGSLAEGTTATTTLTVSRRYPIIKLIDYWRYNGTTMVQQIVGITQQPLLFKYDTSGNRKLIAKDASGTAFTGTAGKADMLIFNDAVIVGTSRTGNTPKKYDPDVDTEWRDLPGTPPDFSIMAQHLNRVWTNDKTNGARLHYSATANAEKWQGSDDSGALDIRPGDGDPTGITGIFPFKGRLFVAKEDRMYQVVGDSPENFQVLDVSNGLGLISHASIAQVDQDDVFYVSKKGLHSAATTSNYGDFTATFLSSKIQPSFQDWVAARLEYTKSLYISELNSVFFAVSEMSTTTADNLWAYNIQAKEWYRWPGINVQAMAMAKISNEQVPLFALNSGKIYKGLNGTYADPSSAAIVFRAKTGTIYPDNNPMTLKMFKRITVFFRPQTSFNILIRVKVDNFAEQVLNFTDTLEGDTLGTTFVLGASILGTSSYFSPYSLPIDGIGHGCVVTVEQTGVNEQGDIYGFAIEYEPADIAQETV